MKEKIDNQKLSDLNPQVLNNLLVKYLFYMVEVFLHVIVVKLLN